VTSFKVVGSRFCILFTDRDPNPGGPMIYGSNWIRIHNTASHHLPHTAPPHTPFPPPTTHTSYHFMQTPFPPPTKITLPTTSHTHLSHHLSRIAFVLELRIEYIQHRRNQVSLYFYTLWVRLIKGYFCNNYQRDVIITLLCLLSWMLNVVFHYCSVFMSITFHCQSHNDLNSHVFVIYIFLNLNSAISRCNGNDLYKCIIIIKEFINCENVMVLKQ